MANKPKQKPAPGANGFKYREQFGVVVLCRDAADQEKVFNRLQSLGYRIKVVTV